ncbi:hypothetical protein BKA58DRAFT_381281 [Alternaria rosae]|uniref:uncharacterized protein n=1 Tax=Alternaria rosae TaxID=1187941 RepID=UPI001E8E0221|nr:uncharacterized protein BKA58DRAFT_381281 [Alternaria rosae]KAH6876245.1 hypothetical protein BKA58DRAFT_381281 [Alternaria rosae]
MLPKFVCNLAATLSYPPWKTTLDWDLHTTMQWERRIPFHLYVRRSPVVFCGQKKPNLLSRFCTLPAELQVRILAFCSADTLFQLMHVSSTLRVEASKLFWADPTRFFLVKADWLLDGGYPGYTCYDLAFLKHVQQVEIKYLPRNDDAICPQEDGAVLVRYDLITTFWRSFTQRFPNATRVIINQNWTTPPCWQDTYPVAQPVRMLISSCPPGLEISALILEQVPFAVNSGVMPAAERWYRSLYQATADGGWAGTRLNRLPVTVLMPTKRLDGPVGEFKALGHRCTSVLLKRNALWPLIIEAIDRHYFDGTKDDPFFCPFPSCSARFARAGEWTIHAIVWHAQEWRTGRQMDILPDKLKVAFAEKATTLEKELEQIDKLYKELSKDWNEEDGQRQRELERGWMTQLEVDEAWETGKNPRESRLWAEFLEQMDSYRAT